MKKLIKQLISLCSIVLLLCLCLPVHFTEAASYELLSSSKIQLFLTEADWKFPEIESNMDVDFPWTSSHWVQQSVYPGSTHVSWIMSAPTQPDIKLKYNKIIKVNNEYYDFIYHYYKVDWGSDTKHYLQTMMNGSGGWSYAIGGDARNAVSGVGSGWIPAFEYNVTPWDYSTWTHSRNHNPRIYVKVEIRNSETGEFANIPELALYVTDIDDKNDGFQYVGSAPTHYYRNSAGCTVSNSANGNVYTFHSQGDYNYDGDNPKTNPGTVIIQSADISKGQFELRSDGRDNNNSNPHVSIGGIMFIGAAANIKYISDNTDDDLSEFNEHFIGTPGNPINYQDKAVTIATLRQRGFVVVRDDFGEGKDFVDGEKTYEIHVEYRPQQAKTVFIDKVNNNVVLGERELMWGTPGELIVDEGYKTSGSVNLQDFLDSGYKVDKDGYDDNPTFDDILDNIQEIQIILDHTYTTVDKDTYEPDKCLNKKCTVGQPEKGC